MKIPDKVKVGGIIYNVKITDALKNGVSASAECDDCAAEIRIRSGNSPDYMYEGFLHELIHAIFFFWGRPGEDHNEIEVVALAQALAMIIRDNPGMLS